MEFPANTPLFDGLPRGHLDALLGIALRRQYARGEIIFTEGGEATGFHVVMSGRVKIYKVSLEGKEQILHLFEAGEPFGEVPVFTGGRFPACAEALESAETLFFPRTDFISLLNKEPALALNMLGVLSRRLHRLTSLVEDLSLKEVPGRLAAHLLYLSLRQEGDDVTLELSKTQLASLLGTIPETLSRILARMKREGYIESEENRRIRILDRQSLEEMASGARRLA